MIELVLRKDEKPRSYDVKLKLESLAKTLQRFDEKKLTKLLDKLEESNPVDRTIA